MAKSPALALPRLRERLQAGEIAPVYVLLGPEHAIRRRAARLLVDALCPTGEVPGFVTRLQAAESGFAAIVDEARSLPLFAPASTGRPTRVVHVRHLERLLTPRRASGGAEPEAGAADTDPEVLMRYLQEPVRETCLVLECDSLDKRTALYKALSRHATLVDCSSPARDADVRAWIQATVRAGNRQIDADAVVWLLETVGSSLSRLEHELEKAMLAAGESGNIDTGLLQGLTGRSREHSVFDLTDALVRGDVAGSMLLLNQLLDDGEHPLRLLPMIAWITRQLVIARDLLTAGVSSREAMQALGGRWNQRAEILERARNSGPKGLVAALAACADADLFVKRLRDARSGGDKLRPARGILEALCRQICSA